jgi:hypothetical protein
VEFIDDYQLLVALKSSKDGLLCVVLMNTKEYTGGVPAQTSFQLSPYFDRFRSPSLLLERGVHKPSLSKHLAPFHQDLTQRIAALTFSSDRLVFSVEALVQLSEGHEGCEIGWDEWKKHVVIPYIFEPDGFCTWVSECRFFHITSAGHGPGARMEMYDFSKKGRVEHLSGEDHSDLDGVRRLSPTGVNAQLPWDLDDTFDINGSHESFIVFRVSVLHLYLATGLNDALRVAGHVPKDPFPGELGVLHMCTF